MLYYPCKVWQTTEPFNYHVPHLLTFTDLSTSQSQCLGLLCLFSFLPAWSSNTLHLVLGHGNLQFPFLKIYNKKSNYRGDASCQDTRGGKLCGLLETCGSPVHLLNQEPGVHLCPWVHLSPGGHLSPEKRRVHNVSDKAGQKKERFVCVQLSSVGWPSWPACKIQLLLFFINCLCCFLPHLWLVVLVHLQLQQGLCGI